MGVSTFGNPRIEAYLQLPAAYRSLSRPSSAPDAKAFTLCSCSLELLVRSFDQFWFSHFTLNCLSFLNIGYFAAKRHLSFLPYPPFGEIVCLDSVSCTNVLPLIGKTYFSSRQFYSTRSKSLSSLSVFSTLLRFIRFSMTSKPLGFCLRYFYLMVEMMGIEPMTPCLQGRCSPS